MHDHHGDQWARIALALAHALSYRVEPKSNDVLIRLRSERGLSQAEAARQIGIAKTTVSKAERGDPVRATKLAQIADFYGVPVSEITRGE